METGIAWPVTISITFAMLIFGIAWLVQRRPGRAFHLSSWLGILGLYCAVVVAGISAPPAGNTSVAILGWSVAAGSCASIAAAWIVRARKATWPRPMTFPAAVLGIVGSLALIKLHSGVFTCVLAAVTGLFFLWLLLREMKREGNALKVLTEQLVDAVDWNEGSDDPEVGDHSSTMGLWKGTRVWLDSSIAGVRMRTTSSRWPRSLVILPERSRRTTTGDRAFDRLFSVHGEEVDRRATLSEPVRVQLIELGTIARCTLNNQSLEVVATDPKQSKRALDACVDLIKSLPETSRDMMRVVFDATRAETHADMRVDGYRWLIAQSWRPQEVYAAASADADRGISAWAQGQLPVTTGVFR